jgi:hypothetical protein
MSRHVTIRVGIAAIAALCLVVSPSKSQELSPEADQAFWCAAAYDHYARKGAFASEQQQAAALADAARFQAVVDAETARFGWKLKDIEAVAMDYYTEVSPQVDDYLLWKDPAALRLSLADCFPSAGL